MKRSNRGAAKVSVVWTVLMVVAFLGALVAFFLTSGELAKVETALAAEKARSKQIDEKFQLALKDVQDISTAVGFYDEASLPKTDLGALGEGMSGMRAAFPDIDPGIKSLSRALPVSIQSHATLKERIKDLETQLESRKGELESATKNVSDLSSQKDTEIADLRRQLADTEQARTDQQTNLQQQLADQVENFKNSDAKVKQLQIALEELKRQTSQKEEGLRTKLAEQERKLLPFTKEPEAGDGKVLGVSKDLNLGWIDLGAKNRLSVGTRFRVVSGQHGEKRVKGWAEVTQVKGDMAEVSFYDQSDAFDPPVPGDIVFNPLYDPSGERHALLIGRFSGAMNQKQLEALLAGMNIKVQKKLDKTTDFIIVGSEMYTDDAGAALTEPVQPTDLPLYRDAVAEGVQVVQLKDLRQYFRF